MTPSIKKNSLHSHDEFLIINCSRQTKSESKYILKHYFLYLLYNEKWFDRGHTQDFLFNLDLVFFETMLKSVDFTFKVELYIDTTMYIFSFQNFLSKYFKMLLLEYKYLSEFTVKM